MEHETTEHEAKDTGAGLFLKQNSQMKKLTPIPLDAKSNLEQAVFEQKKFVLPLFTFPLI